MKMFLKLSLTTIAVVILFNTFALTEVKGQGVLNEILRRMDTHNKALQSLRANVEMVKYNAQLDTTDDNDRYAGKISYATENNIRYMRIDWSKPVIEHLAVMDKDYVVYTPRQSRAICGKTDQAKGSGKANTPLAFMSMSKTDLKANYSVRYIGQETISGGIETWHIDLAPKNSTSYKVADLWIDKNGMPLIMKITAKNNDTDTVLLTNIEKNLKLDGKIFKIILPDNVKCIKG